MRHWLFGLVVLLVVTLDRIAKAWAVTALIEHQSVPAIPGVLRFTLTYNSGIAFGLFPNTLWLTVPVSLVVILGALFIYLRSRPRDTWLALSLSLLIGGAAANLYDRIAHGRVTDFLDLGWWPVFNVADSAITIAVVSLALRGLASRPERKPDPVPNEAEP